MNYQLTEAQSARDLVLGVYGALATGDLDVARTALHPDIALHVPGTHPLAGVHVGIDAFFGFVLGSRDLTEDGEDIELVDVLEGREHVGVYCTVRATRPGRPPLENRTVHLVRVREGRVADIWLHNFDDLSVNDFWS